MQGFRKLSLMLVLLAFWLAPMVASAYKNPPNPNAPGGGKTDSDLRTSTDCLPATSTAQLDLNNVRALLHNGGDMWWDLVGNPRYEVPKVSNPADARHALFAGSLWIGGIDPSGQLRLAAQTYRQSGNDYFPGPLRDNTAGSAAGTTEQATCRKWDRHYRVNKTDIDAFRAEAEQFRAGLIGSINLSRYPDIVNWPGNNTDAGFDPLLAPFEDVNNNLIYEPASGDYPRIQGDQAVFWVVNDRGNIHTESQALQIGIEIQMLAFGFVTANAINDMTFYRQKVINRSSNTLSQTYIGQWVDADMGFAFDDYVGCDTTRGLGFCYNGDANDNPPQGYGVNPPAVGVDFFQGPLADASDGIDNDKDGLTDEVGERIGMSKFVYYENDFSVRGNPTTASHFYQYLTGFWRNNAPIIDDRVARGGNGNGFPDAGEPVRVTNYMFPDYPGNLCSGVDKTVNPQGEPFRETITPFDRRFLQSAGPFTLQPGASNEIIIGVVWARDISGSLDNDQFGSVCALLQADDIAQALFDNNFELLQGPDAPDLAIEELDRELILTWDYSARTPQTSNNFFENYRENDPVLEQIPGADPTFEFEGYLVYQLADDRVSVADLNNPNRARVIAQCDIKNGVSTIKNRIAQRVPGLSEPVIVDQIMVQGNNTGLFRSLRVTQDLFAEGSDRNLVNYRNYFFAVQAYAFNDTSSDGRQFLPSPQFRIIRGVPHKTDFTRGGSVLNGSYGNGPKVQRIAGDGSGGRFLRLSDESAALALQPPYRTPPIYEGGDGSPIQVKVTNPREVKPYYYRLVVTKDKFLRDDTLAGTNGQDRLLTYADWELYRRSSAGLELVYQSRYTRRRISGILQAPQPAPLSGTEHVIKQQVQGSGVIDHGISIAVTDTRNPGDTLDLNAGLVGSEISFADPNRAWLSGFPDINDAAGQLNWIRSGTRPSRDEKNEFERDWYDDVYINNRGYDPNRAFESTTPGRWISPYILSAHFNTANDIIGPRLPININAAQFVSAREGRIRDFVTLDKLPNVDIVITKDRSKWSRCVVVETSPSQTTALNPDGVVGGAPIMGARFARGRDINGNESSNPNDLGMSWFPGYAINVDNGERVNIFFGEASFFKSYNGADMLFNPYQFFIDLNNRVIGGRHYMYVTNQRYDGCENIRRFLQVQGAPVTDATGTGIQVANPAVRFDSAYKHVAWTAIPAVSDQLFNFTNYENIPTDVTIRLRVTRSFANPADTSNFGVFEFNTLQFAVVDSNVSTAKRSLDMVRVVPNPYYGRSGVGAGRYEVSQLDTRAKLTNLPQKCTIRIFTLNGHLVRTYRKDSEAPSLDWDLKNDAGVPIASGVYLIYLDAPGLGTKVVRFFCIMPEIDLNAY